MPGDAALAVAGGLLEVLAATMRVAGVNDGAVSGVLLVLSAVALLQFALAIGRRVKRTVVRVVKLRHRQQVDSSSRRESREFPSLITREEEGRSFASPSEMSTRPGSSARLGSSFLHSNLTELECGVPVPPRRPTGGHPGSSVVDGGSPVPTSNPLDGSECSPKSSETGTCSPPLESTSQAPRPVPADAFASDHDVSPGLLVPTDPELCDAGSDILAEFGLVTAMERQAGEGLGDVAHTERAEQTADVHAATEFTAALIDELPMVDAKPNCQVSDGDSLSMVAPAGAPHARAVRADNEEYTAHLDELKTMLEKRELE